MPQFDLARRATAEFFGTWMLVATVVGSGIMAEALAGGNVAVALLGAATACTDAPTANHPLGQRALVTPSDPAAQAALGRMIFFDQRLSVNENQSCASCHAPESGWTGPQSDVNAHGAVFEGSVPGRFGNRKPPSSAYATVSPVLHLSVQRDDALFVARCRSKYSSAAAEGPAATKFARPHSRAALASIERPE